MSKSAEKATLSIGVRLFSAFLFTSLLISTIAASLHYYHSQKQAKDAVLQIYQTAADQIRYRTEQNKQQISDQLTALTSSQDLTRHNKLTTYSINRFAQILNQHESYQSISVGFKNGNLQKLVALDKPESAQYIQQVKGAKWLLVSIQKNNTDTIREEFYFDANFHFLNKFKETTTGDITTSAWYKAALSEITAITSQTEKTIIYSRKLNTDRAVIAIESRLNDYTDILSHINTPSLLREMYLFTNKGHLLATSDTDKWKSPERSPYPLLMELVDSQITNELREIEADTQTYYVYLTSMIGATGAPSYLALLAPKQSVLLPSIKTSIEISLICLVLSILLSWRFSSPIGKALSRLINALAIAKSEEYKRFQTQPTRFSELNHINAALTDMTDLIAQQNIKHTERAALFASLNAQIIDNKALYNNNQISRSPTLTEMLGIAASDSNLPEFSCLTLSDQTKLNLLKTKAWKNLYHGLTTEEIVNKGSKLAIPYNRIHEIRMRFEVLWRDAEINYYQQSRANPELNKPLKEKLIKEQLQLMRDFEFIAKVNQGHHKLTSQDQLRLQQLSEKTWLRYFDKSMGLSAIEMLHISPKKQRLPATEVLLSQVTTDLVGDMDIEGTLANADTNIAELYNLSIEQGTATEEQQQQAQQQLNSIKTMLSELSNKKYSHNVIDLSMYHSSLHAVPYPNDATHTDLSITEHIMLLSDIFVALTSINSSIKSTLSLSEAIDVLYQITIDKHLEPATFKLFLTSGIYQQYAQQYLHPSQIDTVNINQYLDYSY
ncbi:HD domain-containing phosphohydrolase [Psychromonas sp.]|uniref:HD domain-containing phosphohydrolase n=1 Tax=Psychromonas sp. TaxID=1884585 RepID=UPI003A97B2A9